MYLKNYKVTAMNRLTDQPEKQGDVTFYDDEFKTIIEQNMSYIMIAASNHDGLRNAVEITPAEANACAGDFRKVCVHLGIPLYLHWVTARLNGLTAYEDYDGKLTTIMLVDESILQRLKLTNSVTQTNI